MFAGSRKGSRFIHNLLNPFRHLSGNHIQIGLYFFPFLLILELNYGIVKINEKGWYPMISTALYQKFKEEIPLFDEKIHAFEAGEMDRNTFKGISGGFGSYAQRSGGYMLRLRLPGGRISKETLRFFADEIQAHQVNLMKITTCQTIQMHNLSADSTVAIMKDALDFGIVTKGGGGDNPRNVMASPLSGVEPGETFDVLPCAQAAGEYLLSRIPDLHMPRKLKVGFSNTPANQTHATFRDLGFIAREDHTFSVYCAGGLGPNPKLGVWITDGVCPEEISYYISAMIRLFTAYGNYESRAKSRTRYLQDTLGADGIRSHFLSFVEEAKREEEAWPVSAPPTITKKGDGSISGKRILNQKQEGLYAVSYHPIGGCLAPEKPAQLYHIIKDMPDTELRLSPDGTIYIINLSSSEVPAVLKATEDGAETLFETSVSCIGASICQHGLRDSQGLLNACVNRVRQEGFGDGLLPRVHISGCPSSCGSHQVAALGFVGHSKKVDGAMQSAFKVFVNGCETNPGARLGEEKGVLLETVIPDFFVALGRLIQKTHTSFEEWFQEHPEDLDQLIQEYAQKSEQQK